MRFFVFLALFCVSLSASVFAEEASCPACKEMLRVEGIRYGETQDKTRIVFDLSRPADFRAFLLDGPARVVVDLPDVKWSTYKSRLVSDSIVKSYRSGAIDGGLTRVVFDIKKPAIIENAFLVPKDSFNKDRLVIDMKLSSKNMFEARQSSVFGKRDLKGTVKAGAPKKPDSVYGEKKDKEVKAAGAGSSGKVAVPTRKPGKKYTVVIDPGHGGEDPGGVSHGVKEKLITLQVAEELKRQMEETGRYKVVLTRDRDFYVKLYERVDLSRQVKADLFISIHADKIDRNGVRGASIYTLSEKASDAETERLAEDANNSGFIAGVDLSRESEDVADILLDLAMREKMNESNLFAQMLAHSFTRQRVKLLPNSHRSAGFAVLKAPDVPSVLIETGFISNPDEAKLLSSGQFQGRVATAILEGADAYFRKMLALQNP